MRHLLPTAAFLLLAAQAGAWPWSKPLTKEQVVKEALERYQEVHDDFEKKYPNNPEWLVQLKTAQNYFREQSDSYLKQELPYRQDELRRLRKVIDAQIRGEQETIEVYRQAQRRGWSDAERDQKLNAVRLTTANKVQVAAMPELPKDPTQTQSLSQQTGGEGAIDTTRQLGPGVQVPSQAMVTGSVGSGLVGQGGVSPNWQRSRIEAASLVVNLGVASVECAQNAAKCLPPPPLPPIPPVTNPGGNPGDVIPAPPGTVQPLPAQPLPPGQPQPPVSGGGDEPPTPIVLPPRWNETAADTATGPGATNGMITGGALAARRGDYSTALSLAQMALGRDPSNADALALMHSVKGRADAGAIGAAGGASAASAAAALSAGAREAGGIGAGGASASAAPQDLMALGAANASRASAAQAVEGVKNALKMNDPEGALEILSKELAANPNNPSLLIYRAAVYGRLGRWEDSLRDASAGLALVPGNTVLLRQKAQAEGRTGRWRESLETSSALIAAEPGGGWGYALRGYAQYGLGNRAATEADLRRAAAQDPQFRRMLDEYLQTPGDADVMFLFPGEAAQAAPAAGREAPSRGRSFSVVLVAGIAGGLLLALGLLSAVMGPVKEAVTSAFTRRVERGATASGVHTAQPASVAGEVGGLVRGQYEIVRQIGAGGMGMVYEGKDRSLGRRVAIKKMREELRQNPRERDRFVIEAKTVAALRHPNIVDIYAIAEEGDDVYLVFEYVDGKTVHDLVQSSGRLAPAEAVSVTGSMAEALAYAHSRGVIHRDMKPSNVMLTSSGEIKVMDFGIARMAKDAMTRYSMTNTVVGTPPYMAPEQEQGVVRKESDVYSLAICSYEMLTGKLPFIGMGAGMLMNKINMSYIAPSRAIAGLPEALDEVFAKAFQADPDKRYRTPQEFVAALSGAAGGAQVPRV